ncbi:hypothetical protein [Peterkaempfera sp. SMS 1(5)a]|uniref:SbtR family transcriptional regulator n=1 Tax=Peterkaempfera podocarpi TaxID=3232308 RepID=UPI00366F80DE
MFGQFRHPTPPEGTIHRGLAEALAGAGYDREAAAEEAGYDVTAGLRGLLDRAQAAGAVRSDIDCADAKALMTGCLVRAEGRTHADLAALERVTAIVCNGLRARPVSPTHESRAGDRPVSNVAARVPASANVQCTAAR